jgi:hypothetical protein
MSSRVGTVIVGGFFLSEKEAVAKELGGQPRQALGRLTFSLSKTSPDAYITYKIKC